MAMGQSQFRVMYPSPRLVSRSPVAYALPGQPSVGARSRLNHQRDHWSRLYTPPSPFSLPLLCRGESIIEDVGTVDFAGSEPKGLTDEGFPPFKPIGLDILASAQIENLRLQTHAAGSE